MMALAWRPLFAAGLALALAAPGTTAFDFVWPTPVYQCASNHLTWSGGTPPFRVVLAPIFQVPFIYNIPASAYQNGVGAYDILMQMGSGTRYVLFMMDATGMGSTMTTTMDTVQGYDQSACISPSAVAINSTGLPFSFQVFQENIIQCETTFNITWTLDTNITGPYNMTVMSLSKAFLPFDLYVGNTSAFDWQVNLPAGDEFTVMMNSPLGYGRGGVASTYAVNATEGGNAACLAASPTTTGQPAGATKTGSGSGNMGDGDRSGSGGQTGAPGTSKGVTIGAALGSAVTVAAIALLGVAIWWFRRRRRARGGASSPGGFGDSGAGADGRRRQRQNSGRRHDPYDPDAPDLLGSSERVDEYRHHHGGGGGLTRAGTFDTVPSSDPDPDGEWASSSPVRSRTGAYPLPPAWPHTAASASSDSNRSADYANPFETPQPESPSDGVEFVGRAGYARAPPRDGRPSYSASDLSTPYSGTYTGLDSGSRSGAAGQRVNGQSHSGGLTKFDDETAEAIALAALPSTADARRGAGTGSPPVILNGPPQGAFRVTNAAEGDPLPPPAPAQSNTPGLATRRAPRLREPGMEAQPRFRRHADAGRVDGGTDGGGEVIDLPPMYTDIVQGEVDVNGDGAGRRADGDAEERLR